MAVIFGLRGSLPKRVLKSAMNSGTPQANQTSRTGL